MKKNTVSFSLLVGILLFGFSALSTSGDAESCIANDYPGNSNFCLTGEEKFNFSCLQVVTNALGERLKITCNDGRKWSLTCLQHGGKCNVSDDQLCHGISQWNVGDHCTHSAAPNG